MKKQIFAAILVLWFGTYSAQEKETIIDDINLQGKFLSTPYKKVNENIIVITKEELKNSPAKSIDEVLQQFAGLDIRRRGANGVQSDVSVRGGSFEQTMILINGIRMNDSQTGHNSLNIPIDLSNVERIEVIKGSAARRFGNNAYAGAINIITKTSGEEKVTVSAEGGDFSTYNVGLAANFGTEKFSNLIQTSSGASEGYRHNTDYKINTAFYQGQYRLNQGKLQFQAGFSEKKFGANGFYASPLATEQYEEMQASVVSLMHQQNFGKFSLNSNVYWRRGQDMYLYNRENPSIYRNMHIGNNVGGEINGSYKSKLGTTGLGVELRKEYLVSNNLGNRNRFVTQLFFEHHFSFLQDKLQISPGISWADFSNNDSFFYPGLDVGYDITEHHKVFGNIAKTHRIPTFTDLYYVSNTEIGNPDLKPENAVYYEVGYRFSKDNLLAKVSFFNRETKNGIDWIKSGLTSKWEAENVGHLTTRGIETEIQQHFNGFFKSYSLGYTYLDVRMDENSPFSRYAMDHLKHQLIAKMENRFFGNFTNQLVYRYQERANSYSYNLLDEKLSYQWKNLNIYLLINNITGSEYTEAFGVPMPGRWFHLGFSYTVK